MSDKFKYSDEQLKDLLDGIYSGAITEYNIPEDLYFAIADYLKGGLYQGFGGTLEDFSGKDLELLNELRENVYMFSAAKSYQEMKDIGSLMVDENGDLISNREFNQLGAQKFDQWNENWGRTEYNTAVAQGTMAVKWNEIESNKDLLPILSYSTIGDACDICAPLDGLTAPVDDPVWNDIYPTNHFNCECIVTQHEEGKELTPVDEKEQIYDQVTKEMDDVFMMNSGKDGYVFSPEHPYFGVEPKDREFAKENFGLPIPSVEEEIGGKVSLFTPAMSLDEARKFAEDNLGIKNNTCRLDLDAHNEVNKRIFELKEQYNNRLSNFGNDSRPGVMASAHSFLMNFNSRYFNNLEYFTDVYKDSMASGFHPRGGGLNVIKEVVDHEFGHVLTSSDLTPLGKWKTDFQTDMEKVRRAYNREMKLVYQTELNKKWSYMDAMKAVRDHPNYISEYAQKNLHEFVAEGFAMANNSENPSLYATNIFKAITKKYSK